MGLRRRAIWSGGAADVNKVPTGILVVGAIALAAVVWAASRGTKGVVSDLVNGVLGGAGAALAPVLDPVTQPLASLFVGLKNPLVGVTTPAEREQMRLDAATAAIDPFAWVYEGQETGQAVGAEPAKNPFDYAYY